MPTNAKRPDAAHIMGLATNLAMATGTNAYLAAHAELEAAVYTALHGVDPAKLAQATPTMGRVELTRAMDLVRRAAERIRCLHAELARAEAQLAMAEDPAPPGAMHGATAANTGHAQAVA